MGGAVTAPQLDLLNRDLIQSHIHAIWLSEAELISARRSPNCLSSLKMTSACRFSRGWSRN